MRNAKVSSIKKSADDTTYHIVLARASGKRSGDKSNSQDIKDMSGNKATEAASVVYHKDSVIVEKRRHYRSRRNRSSGQITEF